MTLPNKVVLKTELEHQLYTRYIEEQNERLELQKLVKDLSSQIELLQQQLKLNQEQKNVPLEKEQQTTDKPQEAVEYWTDDEELARETEWVRQKSRKKRKLNTTLSPPSQGGSLEESQAGTKTVKPKEKRIPQPPPIIVENIRNYQQFYDLLLTRLSGDSFIVKMMSGETVKINAKDEDSYRAVRNLLSENNCLWHSYENKQDRPIRVMVKNLHSSCLPDRIVEDLNAKGYKIQEVVNKLSWRTKEPLNMFMLSFQKDEDINHIYGIKAILGCKVDVQPLKTSKLIPQCKRCQAYGHTQKYCSKEPRCVKCTGKHLTKDCTKTIATKPKCVHCGEPHPANYRGCIVAKELQQLKNKVSKRKAAAPKFPASDVERQQPHRTTHRKVTNSVSFAQMTKATQPRPQPTAPPNSNNTTTEDNISKILSMLTSFDQRLRYIEAKQSPMHSIQK